MEERVAQTGRGRPAPPSRQTQPPEPRQQVARQAHRGEPGLVGGEIGGREMGQAGGFEVADDLLTPTSPAVQRFEKRDVRVREVGQAELIAIPVEVGEGELGSRMRDFAADQKAAARRLSAQIDIGRHLRHLPHVPLRGTVGGHSRDPAQAAAARSSVSAGPR